MQCRTRRTDTLRIAAPGPVANGCQVAVTDGVTTDQGLAYDIVYTYLLGIQDLGKQPLAVVVVLAQSQLSPSAAER